jgi:superfamily II DNA or RNA helicase
MFLGIEEKEVGQISGGKRKPNVEDLVAGYGHVIIDECHHLPASPSASVRSCATWSCSREA